VIGERRGGLGRRGAILPDDDGGAAGAVCNSAFDPRRVRRHDGGTGGEPAPRWRYAGAGRGDAPRSEV